MKVEINIETKAKFIAQYWGQKIGATKYVGDLKIGKSNFSNIEWINIKPLSIISDEDAIECYDILYPGTKWPDDYKIKEIKSWFNDEYGIATIKHKWAVGNVFDFLRSRDYLVPFSGLSCEELIEAGWAKYKE